jgi:hypothetical protein
MYLIQIYDDNTYDGLDWSFGVSNTIPTKEQIVKFIKSYFTKKMGYFPYPLDEFFERDESIVLDEIRLETLINPKSFSWTFYCKGNQYWISGIVQEMINWE